jgi:hypothetical protein
MKKIIIVLIITLVTNTNLVKAQVTDTLAYLRSIEANKAQFIGRDFAYLVSNLQIQIKHFRPDILPKQIAVEASTSFGFKRISAELGSAYIFYPRIDIEWQSTLNINGSRAVAGRWDGVSITPVLNRYGNCIIKDIIILY